MVAYSFKRQFIVPIWLGLGVHFRIDPSAPEAFAKRQTIRAGVIRRSGDAWSKREGGRRHARPGENLQLYFGMRTKKCHKLGDAVCSAIEPVIIWVSEKPPSIMLAGKLLGPRQLQAFARADGFTDAAEMGRFWMAEHGAGKFEGVVIRWEPPR